MAFHLGTNNPLIGMAEVEGEGKALAYMRAFSKQGLILHNGYTKISQLLAAGGVSHCRLHASDQIRKNPRAQRSRRLNCASIRRLRRSLRSLYRSMRRIRIRQDCWLIFTCPKEGQNSLREIDKIPLRRGVDADSKRIADLIEQMPHVIKYEGDAGKYIKQF